MSGGTFNYVQNRHEFTDAIDRIEKEIQSGNWRSETVEQFENGIAAIKKMIIYIQRIDWLLACDDGEDSFHILLAEDLSKIKIEEVRTGKSSSDV